jgi:hypothetical protein
LPFDFDEKYTRSLFMRNSHVLQPALPTIDVILHKDVAGWRGTQCWTRGHATNNDIYFDHHELLEAGPVSGCDTCGAPEVSTQPLPISCASPARCGRELSGGQSAVRVGHVARATGYSGFATDIMNRGGTISFKVKTDTAAYHRHHRIGYYNVTALKVATVRRSVALAIPTCLFDRCQHQLD